MKEFVISEAKVETAVLVGLITQTQDERKTNEYLDELAFLAETTGIAGYTLIFNSHGIRIKSHQPFQSVYAALEENKDIESKSELVETEKERLMVRDTDSGKKIKEDIDGLKMLLQAYRNGDFEI